MTIFNTAIVAFLLVITSNVMAGESEVTWTEPEKYTDVRPGNESKTRFQKRIFKKFEEHFAKLSEQLPQGQKLKINVTNVDLAGDVRFGNTQQIRIVKDIYIPRLKFTYELINADKSIVKTEEVDLKDMNFMFFSSSHSMRKELGYEMRMLDKWFKETLL